MKNALRDLVRVRITVRLELGFGSALGLGSGLWLWLTLGSEICKLRMRDFDVAQRSLQIAQMDKSRATELHECVMVPLARSDAHYAELKWP